MILITYINLYYCRKGFKGIWNQLCLRADEAVLFYLCSGALAPDIMHDELEGTWYISIDMHTHTCSVYV